MFDYHDEKMLYRPHKPSGHFPPDKPRYTMTEEVEHTARQMRETIDRLLKFEKRVSQDVDDMLSHVTNDNVIFKSTMRDSWQTFIEQVKNEINVFESNVDATVSLFQKDLESNYANLSEDINIKIETLNSLIDKFDEDYVTKLTEVQTSIQEQYNEFTKAVNSRIDNNNNAFEQSFADYQQKTTTEINMFENSVNQNIALFTSSIQEAFETFKSTWTQIVEERLNQQDAKLDDAELYMRTNLVGTVTQAIGDMHSNGEFVDIINGELFNDLEDKIKYSVSSVSILKYSYLVKPSEINTDYNVWNDAIKKAILDTSDTALAIYFPSGIYYIDEEIIPALNTHLMGASTSSTFIQVVPNSNINGIVIDETKTSNSIVIENLTIKGDLAWDSFIEKRVFNSSTGTGVILKSMGEADNFTLKNVCIENFANDGVEIDTDCWVIKLSDCVIRRNGRYGLYSNHASDNSFSDLAIYSNGICGIYCIMGGLNKWNNIKVYLNSWRGKSDNFNAYEIGGVLLKQVSHDVWNNIDLQENYTSGLVLNGCKDIMFNNTIFDANGYLNDMTLNAYDVYLYGTNNTKLSTIFRPYTQGRGIIKSHCHLSVNCADNIIQYILSDKDDTECVTNEVTNYSPESNNRVFNTMLGERFIECIEVTDADFPQKETYTNTITKNTHDNYTAVRAWIDTNWYTSTGECSMSEDNIYCFINTRELSDSVIRPYKVYVEWVNDNSIR